MARIRVNSSSAVELIREGQLTLRLLTGTQGTTNLPNNTTYEISEQNFLDVFGAYNCSECHGSTTV
jgi:hypothetical protein